MYESVFEGVYPRYDLNLRFTPREGEDHITEALHDHNVGLVLAGELAWEDLIEQAAHSVIASVDPDDKLRLITEFIRLLMAVRDSLNEQVNGFDIAFGDDQ